MGTDFIVGDFAGAGGWDEAARLAWFTSPMVGVEIDAAACATARAAGHERINGDVRAETIPLIERMIREHGPTFGYQAGPPCQTFSAAGAGDGRRHLSALLLALKLVAQGWTPEEAIASVHDSALDERSVLVLHPMRVIYATRPAWVLLEEVPQVLPIWQAYAETLSDLGYSARTEVLNTEQYGVPQTRRRAILSAARREVATSAAWAEPTHSKYHARTPERLDEGVLPWVPWGEALGFDGEATIVSNYGTGGDASKRGERTNRQPAATVTSKVDRNKIIYQLATAGATARYTSGQVPRDASLPSATITGKDTAYLTPLDGVERHSAATSVRLTPQQAGVLQGFRADYPWQGTSGEQYQQVGNAAPPLLGIPFIQTALHLTEEGV